MQLLTQASLQPSVYVTMLMPFSGSPRLRPVAKIIGHMWGLLMPLVMSKQQKGIGSSPLVHQTCPLLHCVIAQGMFIFTNRLRKKQSMPANMLWHWVLQIMKSSDFKLLMEECLSWQNKVCTLSPWSKDKKSLFLLYTSNELHSTTKNFTTDVELTG